MTKTLNDLNMAQIVDLTHAAHELLQAANGSPSRTVRGRVFRTVRGLLDVLDAELGLEVKAGPKPPAAKTPEPPKSPELPRTEAVPARHPLMQPDPTKRGMHLLQLPLALENRLRKAGMQSLGDVAAKTFEALADIPEIGDGGARLIADRMRIANLDLAQA